VLANTQSWTIDIECSTPKAEVTATCVWGPGSVPNGPYDYGPIGADGNFNLVSGQGNSTFPASGAYWGMYTSNTCALKVGNSVVLNYVSMPPP
jgi:hypothetical protein